MVREVDKVDAQARQIWFRAGGVYPEPGPIFCALRPGELRRLRPGVADRRKRHSYACSIRPIAGSLSIPIRAWSNASINELRRVDDGKLVCTLEKGAMRPRWQSWLAASEPFVAKGRDGKTDIYGVIYRPTNFSPGQKYPVIENIYAGPHGSFVPKGFLGL